MTTTRQPKPPKNFRLEPGDVVERLTGKVWAPVSRQSLAREFPADSPVWDWLRSCGIRRPSPSGASGRSKPPAARPGVPVALRLDERVVEALRALFPGKPLATTVAEIVEVGIRDYANAGPKDPASKRALELLAAYTAAKNS